MAGRWRYLSLEVRKEIARLWRAGARVEDIASKTGYTAKSIYRELNHGWDGTVDPVTLRRNYDPVQAHNAARARISERGRRNASTSGKVTALRDC